MKRNRECSVEDSNLEYLRNNGISSNTRTQYNTLHAALKLLGEELIRYEIKITVVDTEWFERLLFKDLLDRLSQRKHVYTVYNTPNIIYNPIAMINNTVLMPGSWIGAANDLQMIIKQETAMYRIVCLPNILWDIVDQYTHNDWAGYFQNALVSSWYTSSGRKRLRNMDDSMLFNEYD